MEKERLPFSEKSLGDHFVRVFSNELDNEELKWHFDDENRMIEPVECDGWKLQIDESLPFEIHVGQKYIIPVDVYHRIIKGNGPLKIKLWKMDSEKGNNPQYERSYSKGGKFSDSLLYHIDRNIPIYENDYRYGSDAWCDLIQECIGLYESGDLELSEDELEFLSDNPGKIIYVGNEKRILNTPFRNTEQNGYKFFVDVQSENGDVKRIYFNG